MKHVGFDKSKALSETGVFYIPRRTDFVSLKLLFLIFTVLCIITVRPMTAFSQTAIENGCMHDLYSEFGQGGGLNCTANDIQISAVTGVTILDDGCAYPGDTVNLDITVEVLLTAQARHDIGIYLAEDGGDTLTGQCMVDILPYSPDPPYVDLDGTSDALPGPSGTGACSNDYLQACNEDSDCSGGTCIVIPSGTQQDTCGDIDNAHNPIYHTIYNLTLTCIDDNSDGYLDLPNCIS